MSDLPEPLTPEGCDLRGLKFMPLDVQMVRDSTLTAKASGDAFRAAVILWCAAWQQVPAGSLPDDDDELAHLCGYGRAPKEWKKVRSWALHKFEKCSDGRLYHPIICEKVLEAWSSRVEWREKDENKNQRQQRWRDRCRTLAKRLRDKGIAPPKGASLEALETLCRRHDVDASVDGETPTVDEGEIGKTGTGTGTGTGKERKKEEDNDLGLFGGEAEAPVGAGKNYAFAGEVIKLNEVDLARWRKAYHGIPDIVGELTALDAWFAEQPESQRKGWFHSTPRMLNRKHQDLIAERKRGAGEAAVPAGIC